MEEKSFVQRIKETLLDIPAVQRRKYEAEQFGAKLIYVLMMHFVL